jgi:hypothetical protein
VAIAKQEDEWNVVLTAAVVGLTKAAKALQDRLADFECKSDWFKPRSKNIPREPSVSRALTDLMNEMWADQQVHGSGYREGDVRHLRVECERPRPKDPGLSDHSKPTDFSIVIINESILDLRLEAKTIVKHSDIARDYLGSKGLERFEDSVNPYTLQRYGGMIAYVVDQTDDYWISEIDSRLAEKLGSTRCRRLEIDGRNLPISTHSLNYDGDSYDISVVHLALEIDAKPSLRNLLVPNEAAPKLIVEPTGVPAGNE